MSNPANLLAAKVGIFFIWLIRMGGPLTCPICLELFEEDEAYIPELDCECAIFVHWGCWEPWEGGCLYCRDVPLFEEPEEEPIIQQRNPLYNWYFTFFVNIAIVSFTLHFLITINFFQLV